MIVSDTTLIGISTLTSEINFYTRLIRLKDKATGASLFTVMQVELACAKCKDEGKATECVHLLHLVPRWQSSERHRRLKTVMQDRPDLIESELSGLAFDSLQQCFRPADIEVCMCSPNRALRMLFVRSSYALRTLFVRSSYALRMLFVRSSYAPLLFCFIPNVSLLAREARESHPVAWDAKRPRRMILYSLLIRHWWHTQRKRCVIRKEYKTIRRGRFASQATG